MSRRLSPAYNRAERPVRRGSIGNCLGLGTLRACSDLITVACRAGHENGLLVAEE